MAGVWVFKKGVYQLVEKPGGDQSGGGGTGSGGSGGRRKVLVHVPTNEVITSYEMLESKLGELGWERYRCEGELLQFHQPSSVHLISVPRDFAKLRSVHMYDIVVKSRNVFEVRDA